MANNVFTMEAANLFCGDHNPDASNHLTLGPLKLPGLEMNFVDHAAGGAPVAIEIDTHLNRLESTFSLLGWSTQVMTLIGDWTRTKGTFTAYGVIRDRRAGKPLEAKAIMEGMLGRVNPTEFSRGSNQSHEYSIRGITHYELTMDGKEIYFWDFFTSNRRVGGVELNEPINRILRIPTGAVQGAGLTGGAGQVI